MDKAFLQEVDNFNGGLKQQINPSGSGRQNTLIRIEYISLQISLLKQF